MTHPHILPLFDSGQADGALFYITPYVEGHSLRDRIGLAGRLPVREAVDLARQVAEALDHAHRKGIVHRDIKPENILLEEGKAVVADFGIARAVSAAAAETRTEAGLALGTPYYMSPEQCAAEPDVDGRADLYALGCVIFEMLIGRPPFSAPTSRAVIAQHLSQPVPSPLAERPEIPVWLDRVVVRLLAKDPEDRFETAAALTAALAVHSGSDLGAASDPWMRWLYRLHRRWRPVAAGALLVGVAAGYFLASQIVDPAGVTPERAPLTSIAVFPLQDLSEGDHSYLALGLTDRLTHHLGELQPLTVVPAATMREHARTGVSLDSIVARHGVGTVVGGTVTATDREIQVLVEITDAVTGKRIPGTGVLTRPRGELIPLMEELAADVARVLRQRLGLEVTRRELEAGTDCSDCLGLLFKAEELSGQVRSLVFSGETEEARRALAEADSILRSVEAMDPEWGAPILERGWIEAQRASRFTPRAGTYDTVACNLGIGHAERVLEREPDDAKAQELRGVLRYYLAVGSAADTVARARLWAGAQEDLEAAVRADPTAASALNILSAIRRQDGNFVSARDAAERALQADAWLFNDENTIYTLCQAFIDLEDLDQAKRWCVDEGRQRFPRRLGFVSAEFVLLARWAGWVPDVDWAWALVDTALDLSSPARRDTYRPQFWMEVAALLAQGGRLDSARAVIQRARTVAPSDDPGLDYREAYARVQLGESEKAMELLARFLAARPDRRTYIAKDWWFRSLRDDPRFQELVGEAGG